MANAFGERVREERVHLFRSRRQTGQIERGAADQDALVGRARRLQSLRFQLGEHEMVDRIPRAAAFFTGGGAGLRTR